MKITVELTQKEAAALGLPGARRYCQVQFADAMRLCEHGAQQRRLRGGPIRAVVMVDMALAALSKP